MADKYRFAIDRGGTFTDIYAECPGGIHLTIFAPPLPPPISNISFQECAEQCCAISAFPLLADANLVCFELRRKAVPPAPVPV